MPGISPVVGINDASTLVELVVGKAPPGDVVHAAGGPEDARAVGVKLHGVDAVGGGEPAQLPPPSMERMNPKSV